MRIGIVTFHCAYNFGSVLQAWALKRKLEHMGREVQIVDYRGADFDQYRLIQTYSLHAFAASIALYPRQRRRSQAFESFIATELDPTARYGVQDEVRMASELPKQFDCFICGSDQIWNLDCTRGPVGPYFLDFAQDARRIAYAPSLSHTSFAPEYFGEHERELIKNWLSHFAAISVREETTAPLFQPLSPMPIQICLDPTLLLDAEDYAALLAESTRVDSISFDDKLFVYMLERNDEMVSYGAKLAREMGLDIAYVSRRPLAFDGVKAVNLYGIGPTEFLQVLQRSAAVLTNSFHATVFSLLFGQSFQTFATQRSGSRMKELLASFDASEHLSDGSLLKQPTPVRDVAQHLDKMRANSLGFLEKALIG